MPLEQEDRHDHAPPSTAVRDQIAGLRSDHRITDFKVDQLGKKFDDFAAELKNTYATKEEVKNLREDVEVLKSGVGWVVKGIVGAVLTALLAVVLVKGGVPHP